MMAAAMPTQSFAPFSPMKLPTAQVRAKKVMYSSGSRGTAISSAFLPLSRLIIATTRQYRIA